MPQAHLYTRTLDYKNKYMFQSWACVNTWYFFTFLPRVQLEFSEEFQSENVKTFSHTLW